jgi:hypothetical protein
VDPDRVSSLDNTYFMTNDLSLSCASERYQFGATWGAFMVVVYPVAFPALYFLILYANKEELMDKDRVSTESTDAKASLVEYLENDVPFDKKDLLGLVNRDPTMTKEKMLRFLSKHEDISKSSLTALIFADKGLDGDAELEEEAYERARESIVSVTNRNSTRNMKETLDALLFTGASTNRDELLGILEIDDFITKKDVLHLYSSEKPITSKVLIDYIIANSRDDDTMPSGCFEIILWMTRTYARPKDMGFLHASYEGRAWYWEVVETYRQVKCSFTPLCSAL